MEAFASEFWAKWPKAVSKITSEKDALLTFYDYPAEHWMHLRTTNPIESVFAPVRARTDMTKGPGSRQAGLAMIFKLMEAAEGRWRKLNGHHLVALVSAGASSKTESWSKEAKRRSPRDRRADPQHLTIPRRYVSLLLWP